jgi:hypothetical protein
MSGSPRHVLAKKNLIFWDAHILFVAAKSSARFIAENNDNYRGIGFAPVAQGSLSHWDFGP